MNDDPTNSLTVRRWRRPAAELFVLTALICAPAEAQESGVAEIVVTAERRAADIQSVPLTVQALTEDDVRALVLRDSTDLSSAVPGLQLDRQGMGATPFIRGVGAMSGAVGNESAVSMYVDGVYLAMPNASVFALDGIRQVEVLKGPQGTLFGRNATGGVIQVVTREPSAESAAEIDVGYASDATARGSFYATGGLAETVAASLELYGRDQRHGWGRNHTTGAPTFLHEEHGARAKLAWSPTDATQVSLSASRYRRRGEDGLGYHLLPGSLGVDGQTVYTGFYDAWADPQDRASYDHNVVSARIEHDMGAARLVNIVSWQELDGFFNLDQDMTPARVVNAPISQYGRTVTEELQVLSRPQAKLLWIAGLYYLDDVSAYEPLALEGAIVAPFASTEIHSRQRSESYAVFGQVTAPLGDRMQLTIGGRQTRDERRIAGATLGLGPEGTVTLATAEQSADWEEPTWRVAFSRDLGANVMGYVSWDRGFKSGIYNLLTYAGPPVDPEQLDAYQAGMKSEWLDDRLRLNVGAFRYRYHNIQVETIAAGTTITLNAAAARMRGFDLEIEYAPSSAWLFRAAVALLDGRYTDFPNAPVTLPAVDGAQNPIGGNVVTAGDVTGFRTVRSPSRTATLNGRYRILTAIGEVGLSAGYYHNSGFAWDPDNRVREDAYGMLTVSVDWIAAGERVAVRAAGSNLNRAEVCVQASGTALGDICSPRAPRAVSVDVSLRF